MYFSTKIANLLRFFISTKILVFTLHSIYKITQNYTIYCKFTHKFFPRIKNINKILINNSKLINKQNICMRKQINSQLILFYKIYLLNKHTSVLNLFFYKEN